MSDQDTFAMRYRAVRAQKLAITIRRAYEVIADPSVSPAEVAARLTDEQWETVAALSGISSPSETTRNMCIGLLSMPADLTPTGGLR